MPYGVPIPAIDTALRALLVANTTLTGLIASKPSSQGSGAAIYTDGEVYQGQTFPYLTIGAWTQVADHRLSPDLDGYGWNCTGQIKVVGQRTEAALLAVMNQVFASLPQGQALTVSGYTRSFLDEFTLQPSLKTVAAGVTTIEVPAILRVRVYS
jgi:hypothetical protein